MKYFCYLIIGTVLLLSVSMSFAQDELGKGKGEGTAEREGVLEEESGKLKELKHRVSFLNLLNGLNLTDEQLSSLININKELKSLLDRNREKLEKLLEQEKKAIEELEKVIRENKPIPERLKRKVLDAEDLSRKARMALEDIIEKNSKLVEDVFTEEQQEIIGDFKPCTIPPKNLSDPVRVGQASDNEHVIRLFRKLRSMPRHVIEAEIENIADRHMARLIEHKRLSEKEKQEERQRIKEFIWKVHVMDEVDFELCKDELASEFKWKDRAKELQKELGELNKVRSPKNHKGRAARYFLDTDIIPILEERFEKIKNDSRGLKGKNKQRAKRGR